MSTPQPEALRLARSVQGCWSQRLAGEIAAELRRLYAENATLQAGYDAARMEIDHLRGATKMAAPADEYPALPEHAALIMRGKPLHRNWIRHVDTPVFTADQMRAFADATCALRASHGQAPAQAARPQPLGSDGLMAVAAFRYCLGRMTYIVGDCERWLFANWQDFPENVRKLIQREVEEEFRRDDEARARGAAHKPLGHDCDRAAWERVRGLWRAAEPTQDGRCSGAENGDSHGLKT